MVPGLKNWRICDRWKFKKDTTSSIYFSSTRNKVPVDRIWSLEELFPPVYYALCVCHADNCHYVFRGIGETFAYKDKYDNIIIRDIFDSNLCKK